jgi:hypothetical protein
VLSSITTTPCTMQPVITSMKVTTNVSTVARYTWLTLMGGTSDPPDMDRAAIAPVDGEIADA